MRRFLEQKHSWLFNTPALLSLEAARFPRFAVIEGEGPTLRLQTDPSLGREVSLRELERQIMAHFAGPKRFVLAGSGHIAGVVNPPAAGKYQYWTNDKPAKTLAAFIESASEHQGSWWPDWLKWLKAQDPEMVDATGARIPGKGKLKALEDAPGSYVKAR